MPARVIFLEFHLLAYLLLLCLLCSSLENSYAEVSQEGQHPYSHVVSVSSLLPSTVCNRSRKVSSKGSVELVHKYGPCSKLNQGKANIPSWSEILLKDRGRVRTINSKRRYMNSNGNWFEQTKSKSFPFGYEISLGEIYTEIDIGTPRQPNLVILDTGSGITWIQCKPCAKCFKQLNPIFNPSKSSSYRALPCQSSKCNLFSFPDPPQPCVSNKCRYGISYGDGGYSYGELVQDRLTIPSADGKRNLLVFNNYVLGCGRNNSDVNPTSIGLMGLSRTPVSFVYQTARLFKKYFSYCIPSDYSSIGHLKFGKPDDKYNKFIRFTPIPTTPQQSQFYDIIITGISVAGKKLPIESSVFTKGGALIDSGTTITHLQPKAYAVLRAAFHKKMGSYKLIAGDATTDTCYDLSGYKTVVVPKISFFFKGGVELEVNVKGMFYTTDVRKVCLAFSASDKDQGAILGNLMQRSVQVVYDVEGRRIGFGPATCA